MIPTRNKYQLHLLSAILCCCLLLLCSNRDLYAQAKADFTINKKEGCVPLSGVNFTDASGGGTVVSRKWDLGNGTIINNGGSLVGTNYLSDGKFYITLTATFSNGDVKSHKDSITVHPRPVAVFSANDTAGCAPLAVQFTSLSTTKTGAVTGWVWDFGAGGSITENPSFNFNTNGDYNISLIVKNNWGCESEAATKPKYIRVYPKVNAGFNIPINYSCDTPFTAHFVNSSTGGGTIEYRWDFGDGDSSKLLNPDHQYTHPGIYTVTLTAKNGKACSSSVTTNYYSSVFAGKPKASFTADKQVCANTPVTFSGTVQPAVFAYTVKWLFPDDGSTLYGQNVSHVFATAGTYEIVMIAYNYPGCNDTAKQKVTVRPGPRPAFTLDRAIGCDTPFAVRFTNQSVPATGLSYDWDFGDGSPHSTQKNPVYIYTRPGYFSVTLTIKDTTVANGCTAYMRKNDTVRIVKPQVNFLYVPPSGCLPLPVKATAQLSNIIDPVVSYQWNFGEGTIITTTDDHATYTYNNEGQFNIRLKIVTKQGCTDSAIVKPVTVISLCDDDGSGSGGDGGGGGGGGGGFSIEKSCADKYRVTLTDTVSNAVVTNWNFGDGSPVYSTPPLQSVTHLFPTTSKKYIVTVTRRDTLTNKLSSGKKRIIIIDEHAKFTPDITSICVNKTVKLTTAGIDSSVIKTFTWDYGDGSSRYTVNNLSYFQYYGVYLNGNVNHTYKDTGTFYVKLIIEDKLGCKDSFRFPQPIIVKGPVAGFTASRFTSCEKDFTVNFTDTSRQNGNSKIVEWTWNFGDGKPDYITTQDTLIHYAYSNDAYYRFYTVWLKVKDAVGCEHETTQYNYIRSYRPRADFFSYDTLKCGSTNIFFYNTAQAYNATYLWDYGDSTFSSGYYGSRTYDTAGVYTVKLRVTDENGCKDSIQKPSYIKLVRPRADYSVGDSSKCAPVAIRFSDSSAYANSYAWDFGDEGTGSTDKDPSPHIYPTPGLYNVRLIISGVSGCIDTIVKKIRVKGPIGKLTTGPYIGCAPYGIKMNVTGSNISTYAWDYADGTPVDAVEKDSIVQHIYPLAGRYLPNVVLTSPEGCPFTLKAQDTVIVDSAKADFVRGAYRFCDTGYVQFENHSSAPDFSYFVKQEWDFGDHSAGTDPSPALHFYDKPGHYDVSLSVESRYGCRDTMLLKDAVIISRSPQAAITGDSINCLHPASILDYHPVLISEDSIATWQWKIDANEISKDSALFVNYRNPGVHELMLHIETVNGCSTTVRKNVIIDSVVAAFSMNEQRFCGNGTVQFTNLVKHAYPVQHYQWSFGDGHTGHQADTSYSYASPGSYQVSLIATTVNGCKDSSVSPLPVQVFALPVVGIAGDSIQCNPGDKTYAGVVSSADTLNDYKWYVNSSPAGTDKVLDHNFVEGRYILSFTGTTVNGCKDTTSRTILVDSVAAKFTVDKPIRCGSDKELTFTNQSYAAFGVNTYAWSFGDGNSGDAQSPVHRYDTAGEYQPVLQVTSTIACTATFALPVPVKIYPAPLVDIQGIFKNCAEARLGFHAAVTSADSITKYTWQLNNLNLGNNDTAGYYFISDGTYQLQLKVNTKYGCEETTSRDVLIHALPVPDAGPSTTICIGSTVQLTAHDGDTYQWLPLTALDNDSIAQPKATPTEDTRYYVTVTNQFGCVRSDSITIRVDKKVNLVKSNDVSICYGDRTNLLASGNTTHYAWSPASGLSNANVNNPVATPLQTTLYQVIGYSGNVCNNDTGFVLVTVKDLPVVSLGADTTVVAGTQLVLQPSVSNNVVSYYWQPSRGLSCSNCAAPKLVADKDISYSVRVQTADNCIASDTINITVLCGKGAVYIPSAFTPNGDGKNDVFYVMGYGINRVKSLRIFDRWGKPVFAQTNVAANDRSRGWNGLVNGKPVPAGTTFVYFADVECNEGKSIQLKGTIVLIN